MWVSDLKHMIIDDGLMPLWQWDWSCCATVVFLKTKFAIPCPRSPYFNHSFNQAVEDLRCYLFYWINRINNALHPSLAVSPTSLIITTIFPKQKINISDPSIRAEPDLSPKTSICSKSRNMHYRICNKILMFLQRNLS